MFLQNIEITATTYSAEVDGIRYSASLEGRSSADAIEDIRTQVKLGAPAPAAVAEPPRPVAPPKPRAKRAKIDTAPVPNE